MGIHGRVSPRTSADANENRGWRICADFAQALIAQVHSLYLNEAFGVDLDATVYALDSTTIDLYLALFPWVRFRRTKGAVKLHTLLNRGAASLTSSIFPAENGMTSTLGTFWFRRPAPFTSWTAAMSISSGSACRSRRRHTS